LAAGDQSYRFRLGNDLPFLGRAQGQMSQWLVDRGINDVTNMVMFATMDACER